MNNGDGQKSGKAPSRSSDTVSDGVLDVFGDLGFDLSPEEEFKYAIARTITKLIVSKGYTQVQVARILGVDQGKVSCITRGQLAGFTTDRLIRYVLMLGIDINVDFKLSGKDSGRVRVSA